MCQKQCCPKCGSEKIFYYDKNAIWICGKCRSLFSYYLNEIACDGPSFHKLLLYLACERDELREELMDTLLDPRVLISIESEDDREESSQRGELSEERRIVYQELYYILQSISVGNRLKIPKEILDFIDRVRDRNYVPDFDLTKGKKEYKKVSKEAMSMFAYLNLEYICSSKEKEELRRIYERNEVRLKNKKTKLLCRLIREAGDFDWSAQSERPGFYSRLCAEVCRAMEHLPPDVFGDLFTDEDLIGLLRCRDYDYFVKLKDALFDYYGDFERLEYKGSVEAIQLLGSLARTNGCLALVPGAGQD